ncbi:MAG: RNA polymerase sigma factor [Chitinispirillaceae bacterium]|nr:RNA polymerase sigma factor [Chitinispirillaceae bacterium]
MNEHVFRNLYHEHGRNLYNFILWITSNRSICEDILQEVFVKIWRCETVPPDPEELRRWLLTVTRHTCLDFLRKSSRFARFRNKYQEEWFEPPSDPDAPFLWAELQNLPEIERSILYLHLKIGHTYSEIAGMLDLTENLVRVRAFRTLKRLRETLIKKEI